MSLAPDTKISGHSRNVNIRGYSQADIEQFAICLLPLYPSCPLFVIFDVLTPLSFLLCLPLYVLLFLSLNLSSLLCKLGVLVRNRISLFGKEVHSNISTSAPFVLLLCVSLCSSKERTTQTWTNLSLFQKLSKDLPLLFISALNLYCCKITASLLM